MLVKVAGMLVKNGEDRNANHANPKLAFKVVQNRKINV